MSQVKCWRHKHGFLDGTDRLRLKDGKFELVDTDGSVRDESRYWNMQVVDRYCRDHLWTECPDRMRGEPEPAVAAVAKTRKRDLLIKWNNDLYRVKVREETPTHWKGEFQVFTQENVWSAWYGRRDLRGSFPKNQCVILAKV